MYGTLQPTEPPDQGANVLLEFCSSVLSVSVFDEKWQTPNTNTLKEEREERVKGEEGSGRGGERRKKRT